MFTGPAFRSEPCFFLPHLTQRQARSLRSGLFYEECPLFHCPNVPLSHCPFVPLSPQTLNMIERLSAEPIQQNKG